MTRTVAIARRRSAPALDAESFAGVIPMDAEATPLSDALRNVKTTGRAARQTDYLHVSDLIGKCIRFFALTEQSGRSMPPQSLSMWDTLTFAIGDAVHDTAKAQVARGNPGAIWGRWRCSCHSVKVGPCLGTEIEPGLACQACEGPVNIYEEVPMRDEELRIVGTPDLLMQLRIGRERALHITELKSMSHEQWKELTRPVPEHVIQVLFYWFLMRRKGYTLTNRVSIVYISKGWSFKGEPWKEFVIEVTPAQLARLEPYLERARAMVQFRQGGALPPRDCGRETDTQAKKCTMCAACFSGGAEGGSKPVAFSVTDALKRR